MVRLLTEIDALRKVCQHREAQRPFRPFPACSDGLSRLPAELHSRLSESDRRAYMLRLVLRRTSGTFLARALQHRRQSAAHSTSGEPTFTSPPPLPWQRSSFLQPGLQPLTPPRLISPPSQRRPPRFSCR